MIILSNDTDQLRYWLRNIEDFLDINLHLTLNSKTTIGRVESGITFVGCTIYPGYRKITREAARRMKKRMLHALRRYQAGYIDDEDFDNIMSSYLGQMKYCDCNNLIDWMIEEIFNVLP